MSEQRDQGETWDGFSDQDTVDIGIAGVFRAYVDGENIRVIDSRYGKRFKVPMRIDLGNQERTAMYFCPFNHAPGGKFLSLLKAINGVTSDLEEGFPLASLATSGAVQVEIETDGDFLNIKDVFAMPTGHPAAPMPRSGRNNGDWDDVPL